MTITVPKYFTKEDFKISAIYFLIRKGKVIYIGKSINVFNRVVTGDVPRLQKFDKIRAIQCDPKLLHFYERRWIIWFRPKYNIMHLYKFLRPKGCLYRKKVAINLRKEVA